MRFTIDVTAVDDGWEVSVHDLVVGATPARRMRKLGEFPQRPEEEPVAGSLVTDLWNQTEPAPIRRMFNNIASGTPARREVALFGCYLFHALLGDALWQAIREKAGDEMIELALSFPEESELHRLPWEALHSGTQFLSALPQRLVAITRLVGGPSTEMVSREVEARVLFVVGASLTDPELRPGAEYLGLMRRLESTGLGLNSYLLLQATAERLQETVLEFRPSVVHLITHGAFSKGRVVLKLVDQDNPEKTKDLTAEQLAGLLLPPGGGQTDGWRGPAIVVLNACYSAKDLDQALGGVASALPTDRKTKPIAAELVRRGVPLVVGMAGRVADRACRIFTRRFYETVLSGDPIRGIAQGRRAGHGQGASPEDTLDWALPVVFLDPAVTVDVGKDADVRDLRIKAFRNLASYLDRKPTAFCDRLPCLTDFQELVSPVGSGANRRRVMVIYESSETFRRPEHRYGRTWLAEQIALQAIQNGHAPCLVKLTEADEVDTLLQLANCIRRASEKTREYFGLPSPPSFEILKLKRLTEEPGSPQQFSEPLKQTVENDGADSPEAIRCAIYLDLRRLREEVRTLLRHDRAHVVVLLDDLHRLAAVEQFLSDRFLKAAGLGISDDPIPLVSTFRKADTVTTRTYEALLGHAAKNYVIAHRVAQFDPPATDRMPYEQYLLQLEPPLIVTPREDANKGEPFSTIYDMIQGIPSQLSTLRPFITFLVKDNWLQPADDEDWLRQHLLR